jgi:hypothetical protein
MTERIRSQRMSRTIKAKRYNTFAACIRRSIWNDMAYPLAVEWGPPNLVRASKNSGPLWVKSGQTRK